MTSSFGKSTLSPKINSQVYSCGPNCESRGLLTDEGGVIQFSSKIFFPIILFIFHTINFLYTYKLSLVDFWKILEVDPPLSHYNEVCKSNDLLP